MKTFYVFCPPYVRTGGPEALHQLGSSLRDLGHEVYMVYFDGNRNNISISKNSLNVVNFPKHDDPVNAYYERYNVPYTFDVVDNNDSVVIVPEIWPKLLSYFDVATRYYWFLSLTYGLQSLKKLKLFRFLPPKYVLKFLRKTGVNFLCQSRLAQNFLLHTATIDSHFLADYTYVSNLSEDCAIKSNVILYNNKSAEIVEKLRLVTPQFDYQLLSNMESEEVHRRMASSKLYIDFGHHPGMDRMPREAALLGCCVITNLSGTAACFDDVPISDVYKLHSPLNELDRYTNLVESIFFNYSDHLKNFESYRVRISNEYDEFTRSVKEIFDLKLTQSKNIES